MKCKILIATHKEYSFPDSEIYVPIVVGGKFKNSIFLSDDIYDNISNKNSSYSEMTALYWAWKNDYFKDVDFCGLVHYRRYFKGSLSFLNEKIVSNDDLHILLKNTDILVPKRRNYYIESIEKHYIHAHHKRDLDITKDVLLELYPDYLNSFEKIMSGTRLHLYNMFVMSKEDFYDYCEWIFSILFEVEKRIDISSYDSYQKRVFGFLAERLFNVWVLYQQEQGVKVKEVGVVNIEGENLFKKGVGMLKRKFLRDDLL